MKSLLQSIVLLSALTCIPGLELRASIPFGIFSPGIERLGFAGVMTVCLAVNIILGMAVYGLLAPAMNLLRRWKWFDQTVWPRLTARQDKLRPYVEKYGELGLALFIGVPLPGTGAWSGAVGAYLLGMRPRKFCIANALGVILAGICVGTVCWLILHGAVDEESILRTIIKKV